MGSNRGEGRILETDFGDSFPRSNCGECYGDAFFRNERRVGCTLEEQRDRMERSRIVQVVQSVMNDVVAGKGETAEALHKSKVDGSFFVKGAVNQFGADDAVGDIEVEFKIIGLAEMCECFVKSGVELRSRDVWAESDDVITE